MVYIPHPFDPLRRNLAEAALVELVDDGLVDALEVFNAKTALPSLNERAAAFARDHDLRAGPAAMRTCPTPSAPRTSRCRTSTDRLTSWPSFRRGGSSATTAIPTERGGRASCRARRPEILRPTDAPVGRRRSAWCRAA